MMGWKPIVRRSLCLVGSARLTALLLVVFLILFLVGIVVPQTPLATDDQIGNFARSWPAVAALARSTGLDDVYHSPWMYAVFALFVVQILHYLCRRSTLLWADPWTAHPPAPQGLPIVREAQPTAHDMDALAATLATARYRVRQDGDLLVATRNRRSPLWGLLFHASLVVLLAGGWVLRLSAVHGVMALTEGQTFRGQQHEYEDLDPPGVAEDLLPRMAFTLDAIEPVFGESGEATDLRVRVRFDDDSIGELRVNQPLSLDGADVLVKNFGLAPVFSVWEVRGQHRRHVESLSPRLICWSPGLPADTFEFRRLSATVEARFWPDFVDGLEGPVSASMNTRDPVLGLTLTREDLGETLPESRLRVGESLVVGDVELKLEELRRWGEFLVSRQAGTLLMLGFAMMVAGAAMRLFFPRRMIVAARQKAGDRERLVIGGRGEFFPVAFHWEFDALMSRFTGTQGGPDGEAANRRGDHGQG